MEAAMLAPLTEIKTRRIRRNCVLQLAEHYKTELGVPDVAVFTSRRKWVAFRGKHRIDNEKYLRGFGGEAACDPRRTSTGTLGIWVNIDDPETPAGLEDVVVHELLHTVCDISEGRAFAKLEAITWLHARSGRNLARLARAALRMEHAHPEAEWSEEELAEFGRRFEGALRLRLIPSELRRRPPRLTVG